MAEDFETWICSDNWWNTARNGFSSSLSPCSRALKDIRNFEWPVSDMDVIKERSWEDPRSGSSGSVVTQISDSINGADVLTDSTLPVVGNGLSSPAMDWSQDLFPSGGRDESKIQGNFQDPSSTLDFQQKAAMDPNIFAGGMEDLSVNPDLNLDKTCLGFYECPSTFSQGFFEPHLQSQQPTYCNGSMTSNQISTSWPKLPQFIKNPLPEQQSAESLQFANDLPFSTTSAATMNGFPPSFYPSLQAQFSNPDFQAKPNCTTKRSYLSQPNTEVSDWNSTAKKNGSGPTLKKPRIGVSSPLPTFKVRKEKLGDRITALQQLVSPFGKTDTASVLFEAIDYIKFLHGQVSELSKPYMKNGVPIQQHQRVIQNPEKSNGFNGPKQDLRSRGLCLVPITSTFSVTSEVVPDFWTATFGGFPAILRN